REEVVSNKSIDLEVASENLFTRYDDNGNVFSLEGSQRYRVLQGYTANGGLSVAHAGEGHPEIRYDVKHLLVSLAKPDECLTSSVEGEVLTYAAIDEKRKHDKIVNREVRKREFAYGIRKCQTGAEREQRVVAVGILSCIDCQRDKHSEGCCFAWRHGRLFREVSYP